MRLLFDATVLSHYNDKNGHRAGVFYVALNLLNCMKNLGVDITLYSDFSQYYFFKNSKDFSEYKIFEENSLIRKLLGYIFYKLKDRCTFLNKCIMLLTRIYNNRLHLPNKKNINKINENFFHIPVNYI